MAVIQIIREEIKAKELPERWRKKMKVEPDQMVEVVIQPPRDKQLKQFFETMDHIGNKAKKNGLTEEKLAELLCEA